MVHIKKKILKNIKKINKCSYWFRSYHLLHLLVYCKNNDQNETIKILTHYNPYTEVCILL